MIGDFMFKEINPKEIPDNLIKAISDEWMLISAGDKLIVTRLGGI